MVLKLLFDPAHYLEVGNLIVSTVTNYVDLPQQSIQKNTTTQTHPTEGCYVKLMMPEQVTL